MRLSWLAVVSVASIGAVLQGCSCNGDAGQGTTTTTTTTATSSSTGGGGSPPGMLSSVMPIASDSAHSPAFDAALSADASVVYFSAMGPNGPGIFTAGTTSGSITELFSDPLAVPFHIALSTDGKTVYFADIAAQGTATDGGKLFAIAAEGGKPAEITGGDNAHPRGLAVASEGGKDMLYFAGKYNGATGVFKIPSDGGEPTGVATGTPLADPEGVAIDSTGKVYVVDTAAGLDGLATIFTASGGAASEFLAHVPVNFPAGIAVSSDDKTLIVSGYDDATGNPAVWQIDIASKERVPFPNDKTFDGYREPGGLHRAANTEAFAFVVADATGGSVFLLK